MKLSVCLLCLVGAVMSSTIPIGDQNLDVEKLARMSPYELDQLAAGLAAEELIRTKRSGSGDILGAVGKAVSSGVSHKLGLLGQASAGASSFVSGASSKGNHVHDHYDHHDGYMYGQPMAYHTKGYDFWTLKKSIWNTLFQAVKAITGGVTILKGQLIKGGGALAQGLGKVIAVKGEAVSNLGRHIVNSAALVPPKKHASKHPVHIEVPAPIHVPVPVHVSGPSVYGPPIHASYGPPTAPAHVYGPPTAPAHVYDPPTAPAAYYGSPQHNAIPYHQSNKYSSPLEGHGSATGVQAGVIVLQPLHHAGLQDPRVASHGSSNSVVGSALQALTKIFGTGPSQQTAHSSDTKESIYQPPPQSSSSYSSYSNNVPPFKPLDIPSSAPSYDKPAAPATSYGAPTSYGGSGGDNFNKPTAPSSTYGGPSSYDVTAHGGSKLQTMVDSLVMDQMKHNNLFQDTYKGPSYDSYLNSFPDSHGSHSAPKVTIWQTNHKITPFQLSKVNDNVDKLYKRLQNKSDRSLLMEGPSTLYEKMEMAKLDVKAKKEKAAATTTTTTPTPIEELYNNERATDIKVDKSVVYELRGNRIVKVDKNSDV